MTRCARWVWNAGRPSEGIAIVYEDLMRRWPWSGEDALALWTAWGESVVRSQGAFGGQTFAAAPLIATPVAIHGSMILDRRRAGTWGARRSYVTEPNPGAHPKIQGVAPPPKRSQRPRTGTERFIRLAGLNP